MDLSSLDTTLPPALADAERDMGDKFRAAAMSITQLYKSSLGYTKQAYQAGYSAALADVLSKVQSDIGSGGDAAEALARLMDWSEARQAAIRAFEEDDEVPTPVQRPAPRSTPVRPASAPVLDSRVRPTPGPSTLRPMPGPSPLRPTPGPSNPRTETTEEPRPATVSSLLADAPSSPAPSPRPIVASRRTPSRPVPSSTFNFSLPSQLIPSIELPPAGPPVPTGAKRPLIDAEMSEDSTTPRQGRGKRRNVEDGGRKPRRGGNAA
ncbi:hypothetical protein CC85DRAFT_286462 [Cutaneotrichosporon oleaginosum]|uniref:Uncharacterized protein n=1 Tax=Cutaneotrichosporon oleaginosum TaxID=879819 RepID=A0A0J0XK25_9TREE|nr:uncharacterized protein CC85DRAFT_286462 [Cutaneotrichosporon oleaginosum]KLT41431.1 hypothetical protein CC85DRAFT_286462 [Cutaneotrichosporon oleaginosum]TXT12193.1 hypothetical protein COLE_02603 [Cutaneotrichosporon oleaginosum]